MLTQDDVSWIADNRAETTANRTETVEIVLVTEGERDPYTNEPTNGEVVETVEVVWKKIKALRDGDLQIIDGVALEVGDVAMSISVKQNGFLNPWHPIHKAFTEKKFRDVLYVRRNGSEYKLIAYDERGIGRTNRFECVVRRVT